MSMDGIEYKNDTLCLDKLDIGVKYEQIEDPEGRSEILMDASNKIISYRDSEGIKHENVCLSTNLLKLSDDGMTEFKKDLINSGFQPGGSGDLTYYISDDGSNPLHLPIPRIAKINFICDIDSLSHLSKADRPDGEEGVNYNVHSFVEYWDDCGNYFKKKSLISGQGNSTMNDPMRSISMDLFDSDDSDDAFAVRFGEWVAQDSFHVKAYYKDVTKGVSTICYKIGELITKTLNARSNRIFKNIDNVSAAGGLGKAKYDFSTNALCHPDVFPVEVYHNSNYYGLSVLSLKKHRANYSMDKSDYTSVLVDNINSFVLDSGTFNWSNAEFRNPKTLYCMDGTKYDGDCPKEIIDSTSSYYDSTNKDHVNSAKMKSLVLSFLTYFGEIRREQDLETRRNMLREHFDIDNAIAYIIFSNITYNMDGWMKNAQISIYNNKLGFNIYDCDSCLGKSWSGTIWSCSAKDIVIKPSTSHILFLIARDFEDEIKSTYKKLRDEKIIDSESLSEFMVDWCNRIGYESYKRSIDTWKNQPSYREITNLNSEYWKQIVIGTENLPDLYDETISYTSGEKCRIGANIGYDTTIFECIKDTVPGQAPLLSDGYPNGCFDSPFRYKNGLIYE